MLIVISVYSMVVNIVKNPAVPAVAVIIGVLIIIISCRERANKSKNKISAKKIYEMIKVQEISYKK